MGDPVSRRPSAEEKTRLSRRESNREKSAQKRPYFHFKQAGKQEVGAMPYRGLFNFEPTGGPRKNPCLCLKASRGPQKSIDLTINLCHFSV